MSLQQVTRKKIKVENYEPYDTDNAITIEYGPGSQTEPFDLDAEPGSSTASAATVPLPIPTDDEEQVRVAKNYLERRAFLFDLYDLLHRSGLRHGDIFTELVHSPQHDFIGTEGFERLRELSKIRMAALMETPAENPDAEDETEGN